MIPPKEKLRKFWSAGGQPVDPKKGSDKPVPEQSDANSHVLLNGQDSRTVDDVKADADRGEAGRPAKP